MHVGIRRGQFDNVCVLVGTRQTLKINSVIGSRVHVNTATTSAGACLCVTPAFRGICNQFTVHVNDPVNAPAHSAVRGVLTGGVMKAGGKKSGSQMLETGH